MAIIDPFPEERVRNFLASAEDLQRFYFALFNAQRAQIAASDVVGGLTESDKSISDRALESCWRAAETQDFDGLTRHVGPMWDLLVPDDDEKYTSYNSATNSSFASIIYTIESVTGDDQIESAYSASTSMFDLADYLLQRNHTGYVEDLSAAPVTAFAAHCVTADLDRLADTSRTLSLSALRTQLVAEGHELSSLAV